MPELPEVETIARILHPLLAGQKLEEHGRLEKVWRYGKCLLFEFDSERLIARLGMTGTFRIDGQPGAHTRRIFEFERTLLLYDDIRKFGRLSWSTEMPDVGPDALTIDRAALSSRLATHARAIKPLLLDQSFLSGLGNIYVDECLHRARVHPLTPSNRVDASRLLAAIHETLGEAIDCGGSTISDFVDPYGRPGTFQERHRVYGREGRACPECGSAIRRAVVAQRGTHYCPRCQPPGRRSARSR